ncbi:hypothetical protein F5Y12DRAFT_216963 [Xylaria sp. FL1777]|nr:hypothetical protein F5Y12DRAFT_216963 [Xylaria sp. FL1777]
MESGRSGTGSTVRCKGYSAGRWRRDWTGKLGVSLQWGRREATPTFACCVIALSLAAVAYSSASRTYNSVSPGDGCAPGPSAEAWLHTMIGQPVSWGCTLNGAARSPMYAVRCWSVGAGGCMHWTNWTKGAVTRDERRETRDMSSRATTRHGRGEECKQNTACAGMSTSCKPSAPDGQANRRARAGPENQGNAWAMLGECSTLLHMATAHPSLHTARIERQGLVRGSLVCEQHRTRMHAAYLQCTSSQAIEQLSERPGSDQFISV